MSGKSVIGVLFVPFRTHKTVQFFMGTDLLGRRKAINGHRWKKWASTDQPSKGILKKETSSRVRKSLVDINHTVQFISTIFSKSQKIQI